MNDYSSIFSEGQIEKSPVNLLGARFSRDNFNKNVEKYSVETLKSEMHTLPLWKMTYKEDDLSEDNDTEEEDSEDDEEEEDGYEGEAFLRRLEAKKREGKIAELINPKKGFKFFIEQE